MLIGSPVGPGLSSEGGAHSQSLSWPDSHPGISTSKSECLTPPAGNSPGFPVLRASSALLYLGLQALQDLDSVPPASSLPLSSSSSTRSGPLAVLWTPPSLCTTGALHRLVLVPRTPPSVRMIPSHLWVSAETAKCNMWFWTGFFCWHHWHNLSRVLRIR